VKQLTSEEDWFAYLDNLTSEADPSPDSALAIALRQAPAKPEEILTLSLDKQWSRIFI
jgi:hypothetical protein